MLDLLIKNGMIVDGSGKEAFPADVAVQDGKIVAVRPGIEEPAGKIIDAKGHYVTPGFIDAHSHLALWGEPEMKATADENEMTDPITPHLRARDGVNPNDIAIPKVRAAGFTAVYTGPGSCNVIGGLGACIKLRGVTADEMIIPGTEQMKMALGENPKRVYGEKNKFPMTLQLFAEGDGDGAGGGNVSGAGASGEGTNNEPLSFDGFLAQEKPLPRAPSRIFCWRVWCRSSEVRPERASTATVRTTLRLRSASVKNLD